MLPVKGIILIRSTCHLRGQGGNMFRAEGTQNLSSDLIINSIGTQHEKGEEKIVAVYDLQLYASTVCTVIPNAISPYDSQSGLACFPSAKFRLLIKNAHKLIINGERTLKICHCWSVRGGGGYKLPFKELQSDNS